MRKYWCDIKRTSEVVGCREQQQMNAFFSPIKNLFIPPATKLLGVTYTNQSNRDFSLVSVAFWGLKIPFVIEMFWGFDPLLTRGLVEVDLVLPGEEYRPSPMTRSIASTGVRDNDGEELVTPMPEFQVTFTARAALTQMANKSQPGET